MFEQKAKEQALKKAEEERELKAKAAKDAQILQEAAKLNTIKAEQDKESQQQKVN